MIHTTSIDGNSMNVREDTAPGNFVQSYYDMVQLKVRVRNLDGDDPVLDFYNLTSKDTAWPHLYRASMMFSIAYGSVPQRPPVPGMIWNGSDAADVVLAGDKHVEDLRPAFSLNKRQVQNLGLERDASIVKDFQNYMEDELRRGVALETFLDVCDQNEGAAFKNYRRSKSDAQLNNNK